MPASHPPLLRAITYLAPGLPLEFFEVVARHLGRALDRPVALESDERISGPMHGDHDPFAAGRADIGFVCSPSFLYLRAQPEPSVELVPAGFVFRDPRNGGRPLYFSDVIVRTDRRASSLDDLRDTVFGFNDGCSLSGYYSARQELARRADGDGFFRAELCTGSHAASIRAVLDGDVDVAAIDSNVLALEQRRQPALRERLRVLESWGPHPIQPVVVSRALAPELRERLGDALLGVVHDPHAGAALTRLGLERCVPLDEAEYEDERRTLEALGQLERCPRDDQDRSSETTRDDARARRRG